MDLNYQELQRALFRMKNNGAVSLPHDSIPGIDDSTEFVIINAEKWESVAWNPPEGSPFTEIDAEASPKPVWQEIVHWHFLSVLGLHENEEAEKRRSWTIRQARDSLLAKTFLGSDAVHTGAGLQHMPALISMGGNWSAGNMHERVVLRREENHESVVLWKQSEVADFVDALAKKTNQIESARNRIRQKVEAYVATLSDTNGGLDEAATDDEKIQARMAALEKLETLIDEDTLPASIEAEMVRLQSETEPADLSTLRAVLCERMEAAATGRQKHIKGAVTQQAIDNWAQCVGIDDALQEVSKQCALACIEIQRSASNSDAQAAYDAGVAAINAVTPVHTPVWTVTVNGVDADYPAGHADPVAVEGSTVTVRARHPAGETIDGKVVLTSLSSDPVTVAEVSDGDANAHACSFTIDTPVAGETVKVFLTARNLCGPSELELHLTPAAS